MIKKRIFTVLLSLLVLLTAAGCSAATSPGAPAESPSPSAPAENSPQTPPAEIPDAPRPQEPVSPPAEPPAAQPEQPPVTDTPPAEEAAPPSQAPAPLCTVSISCATALGSDFAQYGTLPVDGWILRETQVSFSEGESVFDVLLRVCRDNGIHMEFVDTPIYGSAYIEGIGNLYEFDCGDLSGWMYSVDGLFPNYGCSKYAVESGDIICWQYTCDMGADIGGSNFA